MFVLRLPARRRLRYDLNGAGGLANLNRLAETTLDTLPHDQTLAGVLARLDVDALDRVRLDAARELIRSRALERFRLLDKFYLVALDGTGFLTFSDRHCPHCLTRKLSNGQTQYYHPVLEAKLVCENGFVFSLATEFIENTDGAEKQACERAAFKRLVPRLRGGLPQLSMCLLLDGLFLNEPALALLRRHRFAFFISFKEGSLPTAYDEFQRLHPLVPQQTRVTTANSVRRRYRWVNGLVHGRQTFHALEVVETAPREAPVRFFWATSFEGARQNVETLAQKGGRLRWKIENEGFNTQKNGGYALEHAYSENWNAARNFYLFLQIAHLIAQLIEKGDLFRARPKCLFGSLIAFAARLLEAWRTTPLDDATLDRTLAVRIQIRFGAFDTS